MTGKNNINNSELAKYISKEYEDYFQYEVEDILDILTEVIPKLVSEGKTIRLKNFGILSLKKNKARKVRTKFVQGRDVESEESYTLKFSISSNMQDFVKAKVKERLDNV